MNETWQIEVEGERGWLFEGELPGTVCFVPARFLSPEGDFDQIAYAGSVWSRANLGALPDDLGIGSQAFPEVGDGPLAPSPEHDAFLAELSELVRRRK